MKSKNLHKKNLILLTGSAIAAIYFFSVLLQGYLQQQYHVIVADPEVIAAFSSDDQQNISKLAHKYDLRYQKVDKGKIVFSNASDIPQIEIIDIKLNKTPHVIIPTTQESLESINPQYLFFGNKIHLLFPIVTKKAKYLIYKPILP